ncbi:MAG: hypothetical protein IIV05_01790 [Ruminococcus sp.]|nr:hypothetical protein [Ruminococcus sp.]MBQ3952790.1 hypothetical protein [Ruminococcus sp.]MBQ5640517.1 hypothetical protein [Ruminococcus sp.]
MDEWNRWRLFLNSGSVLDYLAYKRAQEMKDTGADTVSREGSDEIPHRGSDHQRTEYR